jgi:hypothetical protein
MKMEMDELGHWALAQVYVGVILKRNVPGMAASYPQRDGTLLLRQMKIEPTVIIRFLRSRNIQPSERNLAGPALLRVTV